MCDKGKKDYKSANDPLASLSLVNVECMFVFPNTEKGKDNNGVGNNESAFIKIRRITSKKKGRVAVDNQMKEFYCNHENPSQTMHGR